MLAAVGDDVGVPWGWQPGEPAGAFECFQHYLELGPRRSLRRLADAGTTGRRVGQLSKWSARWDWVERAAAWDGHLAHQRRLDDADAAERSRRAQLAVSTAMIARAGERIRQIDPARLTVREAVMLVDLGVRIDRIVREQPTAILEERAGDDGADHGRMTSKRIISLLRQAPGIGDLADQLAGVVDLADLDGGDG